MSCQVDDLIACRIPQNDSARFGQSIWTFVPKWWLRHLKLTIHDYRMVYLKVPEVPANILLYGRLFSVSVSSLCKWVTAGEILSFPEPKQKIKSAFFNQIWFISSVAGKYKKSAIFTCVACYHSPSFQNGEPTHQDNRSFAGWYCSTVFEAKR